MSHLDWDKLRVFHAVAEAGSFKQAEKSLHISHSAISRHINQLDERIETPLFYRHARGVQLTHAGKIMMGLAHEMHGKLEIAKNQISATIDSPSGHLIVNSPLGFGTEWLTPRIGNFNKLYPDIKINMISQEETVDVCMGEADFAISMTKLKDGDAICQKFMKIKLQLCATQEYIKIHGLPNKISDLKNHQFISLGNSSYLEANYFNAFLDDKNISFKEIISIDDPFAIYQAILCNLGIGIVPNFLMRAPDNKIVPILPETTIHADMYFIYPPELRKTQKIIAFRKFLKNEAKKFETQWNS